MKKTLKCTSVLQMPVSITNQLNICFTQKILDKYGAVKWRGQFLKLIFRQNRLAGEFKETNPVRYPDVKNFRCYFNINKSVINLLTQTVEPIYTKIMNEIPVSYYIFHDKQWNNVDYSKSVQETEKELIKLKYQNSSEKDQLHGQDRVRKKNKYIRETDIVDSITVVNLFNQILKRYNKNISKKGAANGEYSYLISDLNGQKIRKTIEPMNFLLKSQAAKKHLETLVDRGQYENKQDQNKTKGLWLETPRKDDSQQSEILLHNYLGNNGFIPKIYGLIKNNLIQAEEAGYKVLNNLSNRQNANGHLKDIYMEGAFCQNIQKLKFVQENQNIHTLKTLELVNKEETAKFIQKNENTGLILFNPIRKEPAAEIGQTPKDILRSEKEVYAKAISTSKPSKKSDTIETEEVNLLAEKVFRIIEKRMVIQKDRRGLR